MCYFDSPVGRCDVVREMVLLDETQRECSHEHDCPPGRDCPLQGYFTGISGLIEATLPKTGKHRATAAG